MSTAIISRYFPHLTDQQEHQLGALQELYSDWNEKINVISRKDIEHLYERHVLHSLGIAKFISFKSGTKILDVGTGGGFPGIPLAILFPEAEFYLVDSIGKKVMVVDEIVKQLNLSNVRTAHIRVEKIKEKFDFIVSRAVAPAKTLYQWTHQLVRSNADPDAASGLLLLKGGDLDNELKELKRPHSVTQLSDYFQLPFFDTKKLIYIPI